jgi:hypothetical protein
MGMNAKEASVARLAILPTARWKHANVELALAIRQESVRNKLGTTAVHSYNFLAQTFFHFLHFFLARTLRTCILQKVRLLCIKG